MGEGWRVRIDSIPALVLEPEGEARREPRGVALWLTGLTGSKEITLPVLRRLAAAGYVAVSIDAWRHGERADAEMPELAADALGGFRDRMWTIIGSTVLVAGEAVEWALREYGPPPRVLAGGTSMGGDVSIALAGIDPRIGRVAAIGSTPDWSRPGMRHLDDGPVIDQGRPSPLSALLRETLDPSLHQSRFTSRESPVAMRLDVGERDTHVPIAPAFAFAAAVPGVEVVSHEGVDHRGIGTESIVDAAVDWLLAG